MARLKEHTGKGGIVYRYIECLLCKPTSIPLGAGPLEDAQAALVEHDRKVHRLEPRGKRTTAAKALEAFIKSRRAAQCTDGTIRYYEAVMLPFWAHMGPRALRSWRRTDVEAWIAKHPDWEPRSVQKLLTVLGTFIDWARDPDVGYDVPNFVGRIRKPRVYRKQVDALSPEQVQKLLATSKAFAKSHPWLEVAVALAAWTGLAVGDLQALEWTDVNADVTRVVRARQKNKRPLDFAIAPGLREVLLRHRRLGGLVCNGIPTTGTGVAKAVRALYAAAGVPRQKGQGLHFLRTSFVSMAVEMTADIGAVAEIVGDDPATVARFYTKSRDARRAAVMTAVDQALTTKAKTA